MTAPPGSLDAAMAALRMQVDRDTVLQTRAALLGEAERLRLAIQRHGSYAHVGLCGGDPVSKDASAAFNERIGALIDRCWRYTVDLESAADTLSDIARRYGYTEDQIAASFRPS